VHIQGINVVFYWVTDVDRSTAFYRDVVGLPPGPRYGDWQEFDIDGATRFAIHGGGAPVTRPTAQVSFAVADLEEAISHMASRGCHALGEITDTGANRFADFADPDGNIFQLLEQMT
jgi:predicted enzyme related to lactoylglutathione lyase